KAGATAPSAPGDDAVVGHQASHAELAANFVVEFADLFRLIGANHDVSDHDSSLNAFPNLGADPIEPVAAAILDSRARQPGLRRHRSPWRSRRHCRANLRRRRAEAAAKGAVEIGQVAEAGFEREAGDVAV